MYTLEYLNKHKRSSEEIAKLLKQALEKLSTEYSFQNLSPILVDENNLCFELKTRLGTIVKGFLKFSHELCGVKIEIIPENAPFVSFIKNALDNELKAILMNE